MTTREEFETWLDEALSRFDVYACSEEEVRELAFDAYHAHDATLKALEAALRELQENGAPYYDSIELEFAFDGLAWWDKVTDLLEHKEV